MKERINKILFVALIIFLAFGLEAQSQLINPVVAITGSVYDAVTKDPVSTFIVILDENGKRINATRSNASENGYYYISSLKPGHKYTLVISQASYLKEKHDIIIPEAGRYTEISKDFLVKPIAKGTKIPLTVPPFELNKSKLRYGFEDILDDMKKTLINNPDVKFEILCYPDDMDDPKENQKLTEDRATSLKNFFVTSGIDSNRITISGSVSADPNNPPPKKLRAKGKRYIGPSYIMINS
jgi:outer membrane protein OmpA-like peptidoglycan-associated protein